MINKQNYAKTVLETIKSGVIIYEKNSVGFNIPITTLEIVSRQKHLHAEIAKLIVDAEEHFFEDGCNHSDLSSRNMNAIYARNLCGNGNVLSNVIAFQLITSLYSSIGEDIADMTQFAEPIPKSTGEKLLNFVGLSNNRCTLAGKIYIDAFNDHIAELSRILGFVLDTTRQTSNTIDFNAPTKIRSYLQSVSPAIYEKRDKPFPKAMELLDTLDDLLDKHKDFVVASRNNDEMDFLETYKYYKRTHSSLSGKDDNDDFLTYVATILSNPAYRKPLELRAATDSLMIVSHKINKNQHRLSPLLKLNIENNCEENRKKVALFRIENPEFFGTTPSKDAVLNRRHELGM